MSGKNKRKSKDFKKRNNHLFNILLIVFFSAIFLISLYLGYTYYTFSHNLSDVNYGYVIVEQEKDSLRIKVKVSDISDIIDGYEVCLQDTNNKYVYKSSLMTEKNIYLEYQIDSLKPGNQYKVVIIVYKNVVKGYDYSISKTKPLEMLISTLEDEQLHIYVLEMRDKYGDALYIKKGDFDMLIDSGDKGDGEYIRDFIADNIDGNLEVLLVTHAHSDHMGGLVKTSNSDNSAKSLDAVSNIDYIIDYGHNRENNLMHSSWVSKREEYISKGSKYYPAYDAVSNLNGLTNIISFDNNITIEIVDTNNYVKTSDIPSNNLYNEYSVAALISYYDTFLFTAGDLEDAGENKLVQNASNTGISSISSEDEVIYKACHHGTDVGANASGDGGNKMPLLRLLNPDYIIISSTINESDHPYVKTIANFLWFTEEIYFNGTNGTLDLALDGSSVTVTGFGATTNYKVLGESIDYEGEKNLKYIDTLHFKTDLYMSTGLTRAAATKNAYESLINKYPKE